MIGPGLILLVYLACLGGLYAAMLARRGRRMYWLAVAGTALVLFGRLGAGFLDRSLTDPAFWGGLALAILALAFDLIVPARALVADG